MQRLRRLLRQRSVRRADAAFVVEGVKVLEAALDAGAAIESVYYSPEARTTPAAAALVERLAAAGVRAFALGPGVMERVADATTPQSVCAVVAACDVALERLVAERLLVVCADVRDPGNLGAILRSAAAAGAGGVVCCAGSADCYNPKVVRASAGALFQVPVALASEPVAVLEELGRHGYRRLATLASGGEDYAGLAFADKVALVLGNEAHGLAPEVVARCDTRVTIPMASGAESLNVAMAATVLVFEVARQRRRAPFPVSPVEPLA